MTLHNFAKANLVSGEPLRTLFGEILIKWNILNKRMSLVVKIDLKMSQNGGTFVLAQFINTLRLRQNCSYFTDDIFMNEIFWNWFFLNLLKISLKCVPKVQIHNIPALVQVMAWCRSGDKPWTNDGLVYWLIYASLGLNELSKWVSMGDIRGIENACLCT